jgi:hypothetical protein
MSHTDFWQSPPKWGWTDRKRPPPDFPNVDATANEIAHFDEPVGLLATAQSGRYTAAQLNRPWERISPSPISRCACAFNRITRPKETIEQEARTSNRFVGVQHSRRIGMARLRPSRATLSSGAENRTRSACSGGSKKPCLSPRPHRGSVSAGYRGRGLSLAGERRRSCALQRARKPSYPFGGIGRARNDQSGWQARVLNRRFSIRNISWLLALRLRFPTRSALGLLQ